MTPKELREHKNASKHLPSVPEFKKIKRGKMPKPFHALGGARTWATALIDVSDIHCVLFYYRDGALLTDTSFFGHFICRTRNGLYPLLNFHWHPSHKGFHCKIPCDAQIDYTNRMLPGAPELALKTFPTLDPRNEDDRLQLIHQFCTACGITLTSSQPVEQTSLDWGTW